MTPITPALRYRMHQLRFDGPCVQSRAFQTRINSNRLRRLRQTHVTRDEPRPAGTRTSPAGSGLIAYDRTSPVIGGASFRCATTNPCSRATRCRTPRSRSGFNVARSTLSHAPKISTCRFAVYFQPAPRQGHSSCLAHCECANCCPALDNAVHPICTALFLDGAPKLRPYTTDAFRHLGGTRSPGYDSRVNRFGSAGDRFVQASRSFSLTKSNHQQTSRRLEIHRRRVTD
jgi:hypothetical protein